MRWGLLWWVGALLSGCVGSGEIPTRISGRMVGEDEKPIGPGLVLLERGHVHEGAYTTGGLIDADGRFQIDLPGDGIWGIHVFHDEFQYLPAEFEIAPNQQIVLTSPMVVWGDWMDRSGLPTWPDQPADPALIRMPVDDRDDDNPVFDDIELTWLSAELLELAVTVHDPDSDLSRMILAYNTATADGLALNAPSPPNEQGLYPNGRYTTKVYRDPRDRPGESQWYFVVSDDNCNNTPIETRTLPPLP